MGFRFLRIPENDLSTALKSILKALKCRHGLERSRGDAALSSGACRFLKLTMLHKIAEKLTV